MEAVLYASLLLVFRVVSITQLLDVIRKQRALRQRPIESATASSLREDLYVLAIGGLLCNIYPIYVDVATILGFDDRPDIIGPQSVLYMLCFSGFMLFLTTILWRMYRKSLDDETN